MTRPEAGETFWGAIAIAIAKRIFVTSEIPSDSAGVHRVPGALAGAGILSLPAALGARRRHTRHALGRGIVVPNTRCRKWLDRLRFLTDAGASEADLEVLDALFGQHRRPAVLKNLSATDTTPAKNVQVLVAAAPLASVHAGYRVKKGSLQPAG